MTKHFLLISIFVAAAAMSFAAADAFSQRRDCFTAEELELVRDAQDIDLRLNILVHAMDRRFAVLKIDAGPNAKPTKEAEEWGPVPAGTRIELLTDIKRILQKAVDDIEDTSAHAGTKLARNIENPTKKDKTDPPFSRALRILLATAGRYKPVFDAELTKTTDAQEKGTIYDAAELCGQIIEAISKLPADGKPAKN